MNATIIMLIVNAFPSMDQCDTIHLLVLPIQNQGAVDTLELVLLRLLAIIVVPKSRNRFGLVTTTMQDALTVRPLLPSPLLPGQLSSPDVLFRKYRASAEIRDLHFQLRPHPLVIG